MCSCVVVLCAVRGVLGVVSDGVCVLGVLSVC